MLRFIIPLACLLFASTPSYAEDERTFAGVTLFEEPGLPICPEVDEVTLDAILQHLILGGEDSDFMFKAFDGDCLFDLGRDRYYAVLTRSPLKLTQDIPVEGAKVSLDKRNRIFLIELVFDGSQYTNILSYLEGKYGADHSTNNIQHITESSWYLYDRTSIILTSNHINPITKQEYVTLGVLNLHGNQLNK